MCLCSHECMKFGICANCISVPLLKSHKKNLLPEKDYTNFFSVYLTV